MVIFNSFSVMNRIVCVVWFICGMSISTVVNAQGRILHTTVVPGAGIGGMNRIGGQVTIGAQIQQDLTQSVLAVLQVSRWSPITGCSGDTTEELENCVRTGVDTDIGINLRARGSSMVRPYMGMGVGMMAIGTTAPAVNSRVGVAMGALQGASLHVELRVQRVFGKIDSTGGSVGVGVGFGY